MRRPAFYRYNYALMWLPCRIVRVLEPLSFAVVLAWFAYGEQGAAAEHATEAAIFGALLAASFGVSLFLLVAGLAWGGAWRELPTFMSWPAVQALEVLPVLLHAAILTHWARLLGCLSTTPVWSMLYTQATGVYYTHVVNFRSFVAGTTILTFGHQAVFALYEAIADKDGVDDGPAHLSQVVALLVALFIKFLFSFVRLFNVTVQSRRGDLQVLAQASLLRDVSHAFTVNLLPLPVLQAVQERAALPAGSAGSPDQKAGDAADIVAWEFEPAFVLQSDIGPSARRPLAFHVSPSRAHTYTRAHLNALTCPFTNLIISRAPPPPPPLLACSHLSGVHRPRIAHHAPGAVRVRLHKHAFQVGLPVLLLAGVNIYKYLKPRIFINILTLFIFCLTLVSSQLSARPVLPL